MKVDIDRDGCISCGLCISICPHVFFMAEDEKADVSKPNVPDEMKNDVLEAESSCPVSVIHASE